MQVECDEKGREVLPKEIRSRYGGKFYVVSAPGEVVLIPVPKDPIRVLRKEGKKIPRQLTIKQLKSIAREAAKKEVMSKYRRR